MEIPFFKLKFTLAEQKEVLDVLKSGWVTTGPRAQKFEEKIRAISGARYAVAVSSATAGLHLALAAYQIGPNDEVITTPYTMAATVEAILYTGARPIFVDIDPETLNIDTRKIETKISRRTKAIMPVDIAGWPCDYDALKRISRKYKIPLIQDAAHSLGAIYHGRPVGALSDMTIFSFYSTKNITTGEGGMVVTDNKSLADRIRHLSLHGMTSSGWKRYSGGGWRYDITDLGYKYNLSDLSAALGLGQLRRFKELQQKRASLAMTYFEGLRDLLDHIEPPYFDNNATHAWHLFIIKLHLDKWKISRDRLIQELEKRDVGCGVHFIPITHFSYFRNRLKLRPAQFSESDRAFKRVISFPFYPDLKRREIDYICHSLVQLSKKYGR